MPSPCGFVYDFIGPVFLLKDSRLGLHKVWLLEDVSLVDAINCLHEYCMICALKLQLACDIALYSLQEKEDRGKNAILHCFKVRY